MAILPIDHPPIWSRIILLDTRPVWSGKLINALRTAGYGGELEVVRNWDQLRSNLSSSGSTLFVLGESGIAAHSPPRELLQQWVAKRCKVVLLNSGTEGFLEALAVQNIDVAPRALNPSDGQLAPRLLARKILQLEPKSSCKVYAVCEAKAPANSSLASELPRPSDVSLPRFGGRRVSIIGIGASTGGVEALQVVLRDLPPILPPIVMVQHSRSKDGSALVKVLNRSTDIEVVGAEHNMPLLAGRAYIASNASHHIRLERSKLMRLQLIESPSVSGHRPSVDVLFQSLSDLGNRVAAVLLTGMGSDGAEGLKCIRERGGWTAAQDKASSVVYGMPKAAVDRNAVLEQLPLNAVARRLAEICQP